MHRDQLYSFLLIFTTLIILNDSSLVSARRKRKHKTLRRYTIPEGYIPIYEFNVAYRISEFTTSWYEARDQCHNHGAELANVDDHKKIHTINEMRKVIDKVIHVGLIKPPNVGGDNWVRVTDASKVAERDLPWAPRNPMGTGTCAGINGNTGFGFNDALINYNCHDLQSYFICEVRL